MKRSNCSKCSARRVPGRRYCKRHYLAAQREFTKRLVPLFPHEIERLISLFNEKPEALGDRGILRKLKTRLYQLKKRA